MCAEIDEFIAEYETILITGRDWIDTTIKFIMDNHINDVEKIPQRCLFLGEVCTHKPINSHSIQKNNYLRKIAIQGEVITFKIDEKPNQAEFSFTKKGIRIASTFSGFCNNHDTQIFLPIEKDIITVEPSDKQKALLAYRAFAKEEHAVYKLFNKVIEVIKNRCINGSDITLLTDSGIKLNKAYERLKEIIVYRNIFKDIIQGQNFDYLYTEVIPLDISIKFAASSMFEPLLNLNNEPFNNVFLYQSKGVGKVFLRARELFVSILPVESGSICSISCLSEDKEYFFEYLELLKKLKNNDTRNFYKYLSVLICIHMENLFISPTLWDRWGEDGQREFSELSSKYLSFSPDCAEDIREEIGNYRCNDYIFNLFDGY